MTLEHATHTTYKITRFDSEEWLNYNKKERSKPLKNEPNCLKPDTVACHFWHATVCSCSEMEKGRLSPCNCAELIGSPPFSLLFCECIIRF